MIAEVWEADFKIKEIYDSIIISQKKFTTKEFSPGYEGRSIMPQDGSLYSGWSSTEAFLELNDDSKTIQFTTPELQEVYELVSSKGLMPKKMRLGIIRPGGELYWHTDGPENIFSVRLHIPLLTNPLAFFETEKEKGHLEANGSAYFIQVNRRHRVYNLGNTDRWHLIMDVTDTLGFTKYHSKANQLRD